MAIGFAVLVAACSTSASPTGSVECRGVVDGALTISAETLHFDTQCLALPAGEAVTIVLDNRDSQPHNLTIYTDSTKSTQLFFGEIIDGGETTEYKVDPLEAGTYYFDCVVHPGMSGSVVVS